MKKIAFETRLAVSLIFFVIGDAGPLKAEPLLTITCDQPKGFNLAYGTTVAKSVEASQHGQPAPSPELTGPNKEGYLRRPNFLIGADKKKLTVIWAEGPDDVEARRIDKEFNQPHTPPPPAHDVPIVSFFKEQISAIEADPWSIITYSFFPTLGTAFISEQRFDFASEGTTEMATFAHCEFSWADPQLDRH